MADSFIPRKSPSSTDQKIDAEEVTHGGNTVLRERVLLTGGNSAAPKDVAIRGGDVGDNSMCVVQTPQAASGIPGVITVATTVTSLAASNTSRKSILVQNPGSNNYSIYVGGSGVSTITGIEIEPGGTYSDESFYGAVYAISDTANQDVRVWEQAS